MSHLLCIRQRENHVSKSHSGLYKELFKNNIEDQDTEVYKTFYATFDKELINRKYEKQKKT